MAPCDYRYLLERSWDPSLETVTWVLLNPSTATDDRDDPTTRRVARFSRSLGFGGYRLANLFARRATSPRDLFRSADPVGPENHDRLQRLLAAAGAVIAGWGNHGLGAPLVPLVLGAAAGRLYCLGTTRRGAPRHPLYLPASAGLSPFPILSPGL